MVAAIVKQEDEIPIRTLTYRLDGHKVVVEPDLMEFLRWFETLHRTNGHVVKNTIIQFCGFNIVRVSTVFLGIDHNFSFEGPPVLFETMVFGGIHDGYQYRFSTWEEAEVFHASVVKRASCFDYMFFSLFHNIWDNFKAWLDNVTYPLRVQFKLKISPLLARLKGWCIGIKLRALGPGRSRQ